MKRIVEALHIIGVEAVVEVFAAFTVNITAIDTIVTNTSNRIVTSITFSSGVRSTTRRGERSDRDSF